jgi:hypothetical protein
LSVAREKRSRGNVIMVRKDIGGGVQGAVGREAFAEIKGMKKAPWPGDR